MHQKHDSHQHSSEISGLSGNMGMLLPILRFGPVNAD